MLVFITILAYLGARLLHERLSQHPCAHPLVTSSIILLFALSAMDVDMQKYQMAAEWINWALGPVTVALAIPIYQQWEKVKKQGVPMIICIAFGGIVAPISAWLCVWIVDAPLAMQMTLLVKSITTPLAMGAAQKIGGIAELAAVFVIATGIVGAMFCEVIFKLFKVSDPAAQGIALGTVAHAVGTAKAVTMPSSVGAYASIALCVNGIMTAVILPLAIMWLRY